MVVPKRTRDEFIHATLQGFPQSSSFALDASATSSETNFRTERTAYTKAKKARKTVSNRKISSTQVAGTSASASILAGASSTSAVLVEGPLPKKRKKKDPSEPQPEKRGAVFKKKCPQNILERVERVMTQRMYMIDRVRAPGELREEFSVLGSTGNVYTVVIDHKPRCSCPDALKGNHCKHILFVLLKVLQVPQTSGSWYQKALLTSELESIFSEAPLAPNSAANQRVRDALARATEKVPKAETSASSSQNRRIPGPDDNCPICYESMHGVAEKSLAFCEDCGNAVHNECFEQWRQTSVNTGNELTCVWCRSRWIIPTIVNAGPSANRSSGGYLNLSGAAGVSPKRDTSSYYHGPKRGQRYYGYRDYDD